jgi:omega-amidase
VRVRLAVIQPGPQGVAPLVIEVDADIALLPENWLAASPVSLSEYRASAVALASRMGAYVVAGAQYVDLGGRVKSVGVGASPEGDTVLLCEKVFPSRSVGERGRIAPGRIVGPAELPPGLTVGCLACVDAYYPELARYHALRGAMLLVNPASIPENRVAGWNAVLSARAAENSVFVAGANKTGTRYPDGRLTGGRSGVYSPTGEAVALLGPEPGVLTVTLDLSMYDTVEARRGFRRDAHSLEKAGFYNWGAVEAVNRI